tara:strand:- start:13417 stop:13620 length:204 start_codon:yes stop_codon:yes gene_type:complete
MPNVYLNKDQLWLIRCALDEYANLQQENLDDTECYRDEEYKDKLKQQLVEIKVLDEKIKKKVDLSLR